MTTIFFPKISNYTDWEQSNTSLTLEFFIHIEIYNGMLLQYKFKQLCSRARLADKVFLCSENYWTTPQVLSCFNYISLTETIDDCCNYYCGVGGWRVGSFVLDSHLPQRIRHIHGTLNYNYTVLTVPADEPRECPKFGICGILMWKLSRVNQFLAHQVPITALREAVRLVISSSRRHSCLFFWSYSRSWEIINKGFKFSPPLRGSSFRTMVEISEECCMRSV